MADTFHKDSIPSCKHSPNQPAKISMNLKNASSKQLDSGKFSQEIQNNKIFKISSKNTAYVSNLWCSPKLLPKLIPKVKNFTLKVG